MPVTRKDSEGFDNTSSDEDNFTESKEHIVLNNNAFLTDSSSSDDNNGSMKKINILLNSYFLQPVQVEQQRYKREG